ncbi:MAG: hypothetical protein MZV70_02300 [Desulfobacterales bacterium]|nr:hypothetical protein [Desulfobacterales bacterium]
MRRRSYKSCLCTVVYFGYGTCANVCPFGAITMGADHLPIIDIAKCTGCRKCEAATPRGSSVLPASVGLVAPAIRRKRVCREAVPGRLHRLRHVRQGLPFDAPKVEGNLSKIDIAKCRVLRSLCPQVSDEHNL